MIDLPFNSIEFAEVWLDWLEYKHEEFNFKYKSKHSLNAVFKKLYRLSNKNEDIAILIIEESMANGWKGFFKLDVQKEKSFGKKEKVSAAEIIHNVINNLK